MHSLKSSHRWALIFIHSMPWAFYFYRLETGRTQSVSSSYFTVPPRAHPSTGSQSGSATLGLTQVPSTRSRERS